MKCEDCIHYEVCMYVNAKAVEVTRAENCKLFASKSRFVELPCKVGDTVYRLWSAGKYGKSIAEFEVKHIDIDYLPEIEIAMLKTKKNGGTYWFAKQKDIGETVFFTREEAEAALEKMKGKSE